MKIIGLLLCIGGLFVFGFQALSSLMTSRGEAWKNLSLTDVLAPAFVKWVDSVSWEIIHSLLERITTMPLWILLICAGVFFLIIGTIARK